MKLLSNVFVTEMEDGFVAVATGKAARKFSGMIQMNATAAFIVNNLQKKTTEEKLVAALLAEYEVSEDAARRNVDGVLSKLREAGWLDE